MIWILRELRRIEFVPAVRPLIIELRRIHYHLPENEIENLLSEFGEGQI
jgi:hypothetical protein